MNGRNPELDRIRAPARRRITSSREQPRRPSQIFHKMATEPARTLKWRDAALVVCFSLTICLPLAGLVLHLDKAFVLEENRVLASRPNLKLNAAELARYPAAFEAYFNDQFGFRRRLIHWLNTVKVAVLAVSPSPKVILGREGWLFYGDIDIQYYRAIKPLTAVHLDRWQRRLESRRNWLAARGIPYLVVVAPIKSTIYPEYMPREYNRVHSETRLDQLMAHLKAHSNLTIVDLRESLLEAKSRDQVYYRTDSHWNNRGAHVGYTRIIESLSRWFLDLEAIPRSEFEEASFSEPGRDLSLILGMRDYYWDRYVDLKLKRPKLAHELQQASTGEAPAGKLETLGPDILFEHPDQKLPTAVMFRDSFATWLIPLLSEHFRRIVFSWQYTFDYELVERERPTVVIQEMVERALMDSSAPSQ